MFPSINSYFNQFIRRNGFVSVEASDEDTNRGSLLFSLLQRKLGPYFPYVTYFSVLLLLVSVGSLPHYTSIVSDESGNQQTSTINDATQSASTSTSTSSSSTSASSQSTSVSLLRVFAFSFLFMSLLLSLRSCLTNMIIRRNASVDASSRFASAFVTSLIELRSNPEGLAQLRNRLRLAMLNRDFTGDDYELLQQLDSPFQNVNRGVPQQVIDRLPVHSIDESHRMEANPSSSNTSSATSLVAEEESAPYGICPICLEPFAVGDEVRTAVCMHGYHKRCIDPWLRENRTCPVCKCIAVDVEHS